MFVISSRLKPQALFFRSNSRIANMQPSTLSSALLSFLLSFPALARLVLLLFVVYFLLLTWNCASMRLFLLVRSQDLSPLDPSARSQFRALSYRQISSRIGQAVAKASVRRLLGIPRLPMPPIVPRSVLARTALPRQILFLLLSFPLMPPLLLLFLCPPLSPPPLLFLPNLLFLFLRCSPLLSCLSVIDLCSFL